MEKSLQDCSVNDLSIAVDYSLTANLDVVDRLVCLQTSTPLLELLPADLLVYVQLFLRGCLQLFKRTVLLLYFLNDFG